MKLKSLDTGYWLAWWNCNLWIQWPKWRSPTMADAFGWVTETMIEEAEARSRAAHRLAAAKGAPT